ncbi:MAG TPA: hypothetical protein VLM37_10945 [Fibrobacteraceae bacterium]|nr:hypothetical protein [Fibrobacteraceae bacterium]
MPGRVLLRLLLCLIFGTIAASAKVYTRSLDSIGDQQVELELDPYYSSLDYIINIDHSAIPTLDPTHESGLYSYLFWNLPHPRSFLLEGSFNPLPFTGAMLHDHAFSFYEGCDLGHASLNAISLVTTGFPEPWALSLFWGNVVDLAHEDAPNSYGKGYGGFLLSGGNEHIVQNHMVQDYWGETEIKLKGSDRSRICHLDWSFRVGGKYHSHPDILNTLYFSLKRERIDLQANPKGPWTNFFIRNSNIEFRTDVLLPKGIELWRYFAKFTVVAGKSWPLQKRGAFSISLGTEYNIHSSYRGALNESLHKNRWSFMIRPNVVF